MAENKMANGNKFLCVDVGLLVQEEEQQDPLDAAIAEIRRLDPNWKDEFTLRLRVVSWVPPFPWQFWNVQSSGRRDCSVELSGNPSLHSVRSWGDPVNEFKRLKELLGRATVRIPSLGWGARISFEEESATKLVVRVPGEIELLRLRDADIQQEVLTSVTLLVTRSCKDLTRVINIVQKEIDEVKKEPFPGVRGPQNAAAESIWTCGGCWIRNKPDALQCKFCKAPKPKTAASPGAASTAAGSFSWGGFQFPASGGFSFSASTNSSTDAKSFELPPGGRGAETGKPSGFSFADPKLNAGFHFPSSPKPATGFSLKAESKPSAGSGSFHPNRPGAESKAKPSEGPKNTSPPHKSDTSDDGDACAFGDGIDDGEKRREEEQRAAAAFRLVVGEGVNYITPNQFPQLFKRLGAVYRAEDQGEALQQLVKDGKLHEKDFASWYGAWIFEDSDEEAVGDTVKVAGGSATASSEKNVNAARLSKTDVAATMDRFKPEEGSWKCAVCMISNVSEASQCVACEASPPISLESVASASVTPTDKVDAEAAGESPKIFVFDAGFTPGRKAHADDTPTTPDKAVFEKRHAIAREKRRYGDHEKRIAERESRLAALEQRFADQDRKIASQAATIADQAKRIQALEAQNAEVSAKLQFDNVLSEMQRTNFGDLLVQLAETERKLKASRLRFGRVFDEMKQRGFGRLLKEIAAKKKEAKAVEIAKRLELLRQEAEAAGISLEALRSMVMVTTTDAVVVGNPPEQSSSEATISTPPELIENYAK